MNNLIIELKDIQTDLNELIQDLKKDKEEDINYIKSINKYLIKSNDKNNTLIRKVLSLLNFVVEKEDI
jgi:hypothetical protein